MTWFLTGLIVAGVWFFVDDLRNGSYWAAAIDATMATACGAAILIG